jgi:hypothetical protein
MRRMLKYKGVATRLIWRKMRPLRGFAIVEGFAPMALRSHATI